VLVVAAIIEQDGKVLVSLRRPKGERASLWEFPGGKVEAGEGERAALARELREELGVRAVIGEEYARVEHVYPDVQVELALFRCTLHAGQDPRPLACEEVRWVARRDLPGLSFCEADVPILTLLAEEDQALAAGVRRRGAAEDG
jgi:8-oxo-dGTP diphosphatase